MKTTRIATFKDYVGELKVTYKRTKLATKKIQSANDATEFIRPYFDECMDDREEVKILHLDRKNCVVNVSHVTVGSDKACIVPVKDILREVLHIKTSSIIMFHNHPSGNLKSSKADIEISSRLKQAGDLIDIPLLDSIIITREGHYSLADNFEL